MSQRFSRVLITGATGYVASQLTIHLVSQGVEVHVLARPSSDLAPLKQVLDRITVHRHDGTTEGLTTVMRAAAPDTVLHLASLFLAHHQPADVERLIASNLLFSTQLLEAMVACGVQRIVNTGTSWQHFEDQPGRAVNLYAATKQAFESILDYYCDAHGLKAITLALFDTYGPNDPRKKLIALLWQTAASQQTLYMSPGQQMLDMVHINDVNSAFVSAAGRLHSELIGHERYGVSSGEPMRLIDLVARFATATGCSVAVEWGGRDYRPREVMSPWGTFKSLPGWQARVRFDEGILQTRPGA